VLITKGRRLINHSLVGEKVKVKVVEIDRIVDETGNHVGTVLSKSFRKMQVYCFLCEKTVSGLSHYEEEHAASGQKEEGS